MALVELVDRPDTDTQGDGSEGAKARKAETAQEQATAA